MSPPSVARSGKILDRLAKEDHLSEAAKQWLIMALDPFHDTPVNCTGIPDSQTGDSVTQFIKQTLTIDAPPGITTGTWDCHIVMSPFFANSATPLSFVAGSSVNNNLPIQFDVGQDFRLVTPVTINSYPTGDSTGFSNPFAGAIASDTSHVTSLLNLNANFTNGDYRVVSQGFEVVNTTAELTRQGLTTVYRSPVPPTVSATVKTTVAMSAAGEVDVVGDVMYVVMDNIPSTPNQALLLPGTKQWLAKEGCYVVGRINNCDSQVQNETWTQPLLSLEEQVTGGTNDYYLPVLLFNPLGTTPVVNVPSTRAIQWTNMDISGAFFQGLSLSTSLTINWNICIERFPSVVETDLVVLAKPSPCYCPMAFELYKAIAQDLPTGVMQKENGLGEWFRDAVDTAAEYIQPIAAMIPHPAAQAIAAGAGVYNNRRRQENNSPIIVTPQQEKAFLKPVKAKEVKKEVKRELKPFLKKSKMSVMPSARKKAAHK